MKWVLPFVINIGKLKSATEARVATKTIFKIKDQLAEFINKRILIFKIVLVSILATVAILSLPILLNKDNIHFKHALEWNYFVGVILFYLFSRFFWKRTT